MQTVYIVPLHNIHCHTTDVVAVFRQTGIEEHETIIVEEALRILEIGMTGSKCCRTLCLGTIGIYPCMALHATAVTFLHHPCQGVPIWFWCASLFGRQVTAPWFHLALVQGICLCTNLKHDGIDTATLQFVQLHGQCLLHPLTSDASPLVVYALYPSATEFALGIDYHSLILILLLRGQSSLCLAHCRHKQCRYNNNVFHQHTKIRKKGLSRMPHIAF